MPIKRRGQKTITEEVPAIDLQERFGQKFREVRLASGLTQVQIEELTGIAQRTVSLIERGEVNVSLRQMQRLASVVDRDVHELLSPAPAKPKKR